MQKLSVLQGIGEKRAAIFLKKGIETVEDLLEFFPREYEDRSKTRPIADCFPGEEVSVRVIILSGVKEKRIRSNMSIYTVTAGDESGLINLTWYNKGFVRSTLKAGGEYIFFGKINPKSAKKEMINPVFETVGKERFAGKLVPVYPLWGNMTQGIIRSAMEQAIEKYNGAEEYFSEELRKKYNLCEINHAIKNIHFPKNFKEFEIARKRLVFDELLMLQLALMFSKERGLEKIGTPYKDTSCVNEFLEMLPFKMTNAQLRTINEILQDLKASKPMMRLVQGDVGSGKTAVAAAVMYVSAKNGYQSAIMAPTEILATQHFETFEAFFKNSDIRICLLTGSTTKKKQLYEKIKEHEYDIIIGTHAIIQDGVEYHKLGLVVTDEQHRFGVTQRARLTNKGENVNTLIMTATPIPRTLSFILYGDLDISIIDELPPGRKEVLTYPVGEDMRKRVYAFLDKNLRQGMQCYVVCPLIEETQNGDLENATDIAEKMKTVFSEFSVGLIHGRMKPKEKEDIMEKFASGETDILVSTTVIEVGVNVPNAGIMIIENAERFGLSQLHQLRGRVGRGGQQAYCILFAHGSSDVTKKRMEIMKKSNDGFFISEEDLKLRGPGDFFGTRQHGLPELKIANLFTDMELVKKAQKCARNILSEDRALSSDKYSALRRRINKMFDENIIFS